MKSLNTIMRLSLMLKNIIQKITVISFIALLSATAQVQASESAQKSAKPDISAGEALYANGDSARGITACVGCHGANGNSGSGTWPKLSAQNATYLATQLAHFKSGERANAVMMGMSMLLTEADMKNVSAYLEKQTHKPGTARNKDTIELGKSIYRGGIAAKNVPACASCHGPSGSGIPVQYPRVGGQWAEYTQNQLVTFRSGERKNAQMNTIAGKLNDKEMQAVADYIAGLQ
jgi:cytochrome c553